MRRLLAVLAGLALVLVGTMAVAAWLSTGSGLASAVATTVNQANAPTATRGTGTVDLSWAASTLASGDAVTGYQVLRHDGANETLVCTVTSPTCVDTDPVAGAVTYGVVATIGTDWRGPESDLTAFTYDDLAPVTTASVSPLPNAASWSNTGVTVTLNATDSGLSSGVDHLTYAVDGGAPVDHAGSSISFPVSGAGTHSVSYFAVDGVGNAESVHVLTVKIDPSAPVTTVTPTPGPNSAGWNNSDVTLAFSATDVDASGVKSVTVDGVTTAGSTASRTVSAEGVTTVSYFATDVADNVEGAKSTTVKIDRTAPTTSVDPAGSSSWTTDNSVAITASDALSGVASIEYRVDGGSVQTYGSPFTLADGSHTVEYRATDNAGNVQGFQSATIKVDTGTPTASLSQTGSGQPTISATDTTSGVASVSWRDGGTGGYTTVSGSSTTLSLDNGTHTVWYFATDNAGNASTPTSQTITVGVDTVAPSVDITDPQQGGSYPTGNSGTGSWAKVCSDGRVCATITDAQSGLNTSTISYTLVGTSGARAGQCWTGSAWTSGSGCTASMTLSAGQWRGGIISRNGTQGMNVGAFTLTVRATDNAGNTATNVVTFQTIN